MAHSLQVVERTSMTFITQVSAGFQGQRWRQPKWKNWVRKNDKCHFINATLERELIPYNEKVTMAVDTWAWGHVQSGQMCQGSQGSGWKTM